eukprot:343091-Hanusia_phi.AAC.1
MADQDIAPQTGQGENMADLVPSRELADLPVCRGNKGRSRVMILIEAGLRTEPFCINSKERFQQSNG